MCSLSRRVIDLRRSEASVALRVSIGRFRRLSPSSSRSLQGRHGLCGGRENRRVQSFRVDGKFVKQLLKGPTRFASSVALSPDPEQNYLCVGDDDSIAIVDRKIVRCGLGLK
jgi:hypothetical protein